MVTVRALHCCMLDCLVGYFTYAQLSAIMSVIAVLYAHVLICRCVVDHEMKRYFLMLHWKVRCDVWRYYCIILSSAYICRILCLHCWLCIHGSCLPRILHSV